MPACDKCNKEADLTEGLCTACSRDEIPSSQERKVNQCPCEQGPFLVKEMIECTDCTMWWHPTCVGLGGLTYYMTKKLNGWKCPACFKLDISIIEKLGLNQGEIMNDGDKELGRILRDEVKTIIPEVVEEIKAGVKLAFQEDSVKELVNGAKEAITKTWADVAKTEQKRVIKEVVEHTSDVALQNSLGRISADLSEQKNRTRNCIVSKVREGYGEEGMSLKDVVVSISNLDINDIAETKRLGERTAGENRLILVRLKSEEVAQRFHNFGRGRHLGNNVWVNQDLTRTERAARFQMRQERKAKRAAVRPADGTGGVAEGTGGAGDVGGTGGAGDVGGSGAAGDAEGTRGGNRGRRGSRGVGGHTPAGRQRSASNRE